MAIIPIKKKYIYIKLSWSKLYLELEVLCVEVDEGVEQDLWAVRSKLLRLPQVFLLHKSNTVRG